MSKKFLDSQGLEVLWDLIKNLVRNIEVSTVKTTQEWAEETDYIPKAGEIIVYSDYKTIHENEETQVIPGIKIGDGKSKVNSLPFSQSISNKVSHKLTIGSYIYDGSQDVTVPLYNGENQ